MRLPEADEDLVDQRYSEEEQAALLRFLRLSDPSSFQIAAVEVWTPVEREALIRWLRQRLPHRTFHELSLRAIPGVSLADELAAAVAALPSAPGPRLLLLSDLEELQGDPHSKSSRTFAQLNVQRDLLVRALPLPILLCAHPAALLRLGVEAPDFCDYLAVRIQAREPPTSTLAGRLVHVAIDQTLAGQPEALEHAIEAVRLWREFASRSEAYLPELARSLAVLGSVYGRRGRLEEALAATEEAVQLSTQDHDPQLLAANLSLLANVLDDLGRREHAASKAEEAIALFRQLAERDPSTFETGLVQNLSNLSGIQRSLARHEDALSTAEEAVHRARACVERNPSGSPALIVSLYNLGVARAALGRRREAIEAFQEALTILRPLTPASPERFRPLLAKCLTALAATMMGAETSDEELAVAQEAVEIFRALIRQNWDEFAPHLADGLINLGGSYLRQGKIEGARAAIEEAVSTRRALAGSSPAGPAELASCLHNLAIVQMQLDQRDDARRSLEESLRILRALPSPGLEARAALGLCLLQLSGWHQHFGDLGAALSMNLEVAQIFRGLPGRQPEGRLLVLVQRLLQLSSAFLSRRMHGPARTAAETAAPFARELAERSPETHIPVLAQSLVALSFVRSAEGDREAALQAAEESVELLRSLATHEQTPTSGELLAECEAHLERLRRPADL